MLGVAGSNLTIFKFEPTTPNMSQHIATMLRYVALACYDRLAGAYCMHWDRYMKSSTFESDSPRSRTDRLAMSNLNVGSIQIASVALNCFKR